MTRIGDEDWKQLAASWGLVTLPLNVRAEIEDAISDYIEDEGPGAHRVTPETRSLLSRVAKDYERLERLVAELNTKRDFRDFAANGSDTSLELESPEFETKLDEAKQRLRRRSPKGWSKTNLRALIVRLLEIRSGFLQIDAPTQARETTTSGRFHTYLELCLKVAKPRASKPERQESLRRGIDLAVEAFQYRRASPEYSWEWDDLFPQSYEQLRLSTKFLRG